MITLSRIYRGIKGIGYDYLYRMGHYYRSIRLLPEQTAADKKLFKSVFQLYAGKKLRVFEWGAGYSTLFYSRYLISNGIDFEWHAIDNSRHWCQKVTGIIARHGLEKRVHLHLSEFPAFWELPGWSWVDKKIPPEVCRPGVAEYVEYPKRLENERGFDVVIVDGRFRRRCLEVAAGVMAPGGVVLLHDAQKPHYHSPLNIYKNGHFFNTGHVLGVMNNYNMWVGTFDDNLLSKVRDKMKRGKV